MQQYLYASFYFKQSKMLVYFSLDQHKIDFSVDNFFEQYLKIKNLFLIFLGLPKIFDTDYKSYVLKMKNNSKCFAKKFYNNICILNL